MNSNDTTRATEFVDSVCTCPSCDHKIASECVKTNCSCCKEIDHSMVLDGMEGFMRQEKLPWKILLRLNEPTKSNSNYKLLQKQVHV